MSIRPVRRIPVRLPVMPRMASRRFEIVVSFWVAQVPPALYGFRGVSREDNRRRRRVVIDCSTAGKSARVRRRFPDRRWKKPTNKRRDIDEELLALHVYGFAIRHLQRRIFENAGQK